MILRKEMSSTFIECYEPFYYDCSDEEKRKNLGLPSLNTTSEEIESYIVEDKLSKGLYDIDSFAWKNGMIKCIKNQKAIYAEEFSETTYKNCYKRNVDKEDLDEYIHKHRNQDEFVDLLNALHKEGINTCLKEIKNSYKFYNPVIANFGPVNILNAIFFKSRGKLPIYDLFAHKAVKALHYEFSPDQVYIGANPATNDADNVAAMYYEYIYLLKKVFPDNIDEDNMFITRNLDRALWVYGHATQKYE